MSARNFYMVSGWTYKHGGMEISTLLSTKQSDTRIGSSSIVAEDHALQRLRYPLARNRILQNVLRASVVSTARNAKKW